MSRFNSIDELTTERHRLERRADKIGHNIESRYKDLKNNPFGDNRFVKIFNLAMRFRYLLPILFRKRKKK